jgi:uncharacterized protein (DUF433 family)
MKLVRSRLGGSFCFQNRSSFSSKNSAAIAFCAVYVQSNPMTFNRITCDPKRMNGQPCVRQLRLTVRRVVEAVATYPDRRDLQREFPELEEEDIHEALAFAAANLDDKVIELAKAG